MATFNQEIANAIHRWGSSSLLLYDIVITLDQEIELVWIGERSFPKVLYVLARYMGLANALLTAIVSSLDYTNKFCRIFNPTQYMLVIISIMVPDALLLLRVRALYGERLRIAWLPYSWIRVGLTGIYSALAMVQVVFIGLGYKNALDDPSPQNLDNFGCLEAGVSPAGWLYIAAIFPVLFFNTLLFLLTMWKVCPSWDKTYLESLSTLLIRDGLIYYGLVMTMLALLLAQFLGKVIPALPWTLALSPIAACRLFLNLKQRGRHEAGDDDDDEGSEQSWVRVSIAPNGRPIGSTHVHW